MRVSDSISRKDTLRVSHATSLPEWVSMARLASKGSRQTVDLPPLNPEKGMGASLHPLSQPARQMTTSEILAERDLFKEDLSCLIRWVVNEWEPGGLVLTPMAQAARSSTFAGIARTGRSLAAWAAKQQSKISNISALTCPSLGWVMDQSTVGPPWHCLR